MRFIRSVRAEIDVESRASIETASEILEHVMGPLTDETAVIWTECGDGDLDLDLSDVHGRVCARVTRRDMASHEGLKARLTAVWEELLAKGPRSMEIRIPKNLVTMGTWCG